MGEVSDSRNTALHVVDDIIADLNDRRGLKSEWRAIEADIREEIHGVWADIVESGIEAGRIEAVAAERARIVALLEAGRSKLCRPGAWTEALENNIECWRVPRDTARLLLRGLLAEGVARELAAWLDERDAEPLETCGLAREHQIGRCQERDEVRAKLRELGVLSAE